MNGFEAVRKLASLGYRFELAGDRLRYRYVGTGKPDPDTVVPLLEAVKANKPDVLAYLSKPAPPERILTCAECPQYQLNPWTHYPELGAWCHYHMDHLLIANPQCISYRRREVPPRDSGARP